MNKVAIIQSREFFTAEQKNKYLNDIPSIISTNPVEIYKFIKSNANKKCIYKYILHINSGVLSALIDYIYEKKNKSVNAKSLLSKCILVATISNADSVRDKNTKLETNIYFCVSKISKVLKGFDGIPPNRAMFIVSDYNSPYYEQIYKTNVVPKYRVSEITLDAINQFSKLGSSITLSLDSRDEYIKVLNLIQQSNFTRQVSVIEIDNIELFTHLFSKISSITVSSSGVGIVANSNKYPDLDQETLYFNITPLTLISLSKKWESFIRDHVISIENPNYNINVVYDIIKR